MIEELLVLVTPRAGRPIAMALAGYENDTWMFTVGGMVGREPPSEPAEMLAFVQGFAPAHVVAAIGAAEPLTESVVSVTPRAAGDATTRCDGSPPGSWLSAMQSAASIPSTAKA
jgi:hypothetical protein